jgi:hypothetical protein
VDEASVIRTNIRTHSPGVSTTTDFLLRFRVNQPDAVSTVMRNIHYLAQRRPHHFRLHSSVQGVDGAAVPHRANNHVFGHRMGHDLAKLVDKSAEELTPSHSASF